jgi:hypothetical protein
MLVARRTLIAVVLVIALAIPAAAIAQGDPTDAQYQPAAQQVGAGGGGGGGVGGEVAAGGLDERVVSGLPFTGFDLMAMGMAAVAIAGTGVVLRRLSRPPLGRE